MVLVNKHKFGNPYKKLVFLQLADNADENGECFPSHQYVADHTEISKSTVRKHIKDLADEGFLSIENRKGPKGNSSNKYRINRAKLMGHPMPADGTGVCRQPEPPMPTDGIPYADERHNPMPAAGTVTSQYEPVNEPVTKREGRKKAKKFKKPTLEELQAYCKKNSLNVDCEYFLDYYEAKDWKIGSTQAPMKNWQAAARNWARRQSQFDGGSTTPIADKQFKSSPPPEWAK